jgi:hypothetical protein
MSGHYAVSAVLSRAGLAMYPMVHGRGNYGFQNANISLAPLKIVTTTSPCMCCAPVAREKLLVTFMSPTID